MRLRLLVSEAWRSLGANLSTTVAATMTVLVGMFLLGLFIALGSWTLSWSDHVKRQLMVKVYFADKATTQQKNDVARTLQSDSKVLSVTYVSKEKALERMKRRYPDLVENLTANPLPDSLEVLPRKGEWVEDVYRSLHPKPDGVATVNDGKQVSQRILQVAHVIEAVFTLATLVLLVAATLLIANTIRLSIFSRRREIEVMKLVGATNWFVRGPFMIEGLLCGLGGAVGAIILLVLGRTLFMPLIHLTSATDVHSWPFGLHVLIVLGAGLALGAAGSGLTIRRFLQV
jgi:cell division transport system permease protein